MRGLRVVVRAVLLVALVALVVPGASVHPTTLSLSRVEAAKSVDFQDGVVWVLVLGSDAADGSTLRRGNTDAIELLALDLESGAAAAIGIPRDFWVPLPPGPGFDRINQAYKKGGASLAAQAVGELVGITPDFVLVTGFDGFRSMTDTVGGVDVVSSERFVTEDGDVEVRRGINHFDADEALYFAATRTTLESDLRRAANHQALLLGFLRQLRQREDETGFMERVTSSAIGGLQTDLPPTDLYRLAQAVTQIDPQKVTGCIVTGRLATVGEDNASVIIPNSPLAQRLGRDADEDAELDPGCHG
jgi:polyisoprenyl-teichoic acid--peptidoglycan teichoic acid transferase